MSGTDNFEAVVKERRTEAVAEFHEDKTLIRRFQTALHSAPSLVPPTEKGTTMRSCRLG